MAPLVGSRVEVPAVDTSHCRSLCRTLRPSRPHLLPDHPAFRPPFRPSERGNFVGTPTAPYGTEKRAEGTELLSPDRVQTADGDFTV